MVERGTLAEPLSPSYLSSSVSSCPNVLLLADIIEVSLEAGARLFRRRSFLGASGTYFHPVADLKLLTLPAQETIS